MMRTDGMKEILKSALTWLLLGAGMLMLKPAAASAGRVAAAGAELAAASGRAAGSDLTVAPGDTLAGGSGGRRDTVTFARSPRIRLSLGVGGATDGLIGGGLALSFPRGAHGLVTLRGTGFSELQLCIFGPCYPPTTRGDIGALYGYRREGMWGGAAISAGVGVANGRGLPMGRGIFDDRTWNAPSIPIELDAWVTPLPIAGLAVSALADWNPRVSFVGVLLSMRFGGLR
jgi:hypothetical protein